MALLFARIVVLIVLSLILKMIVPPRVRDTWTPWLLAGLVVWGALKPFAHGGIVTLGVAYAYFATAFLTNGYQLQELRNNKVVSAFLFFWFYMIVAMAFGEKGTIYGMLYYFLCLLEFIAVGYYVGIWALNHENGLYRISLAMAVCATLITVLYLRTGSLDATITAERVGINAEDSPEGDVTNVNWIGLSMVSMLPLLFLSSLSPLRHHKMLIFIKALGAFNFIVLSLILARTGSRNSVLAFVPMVYYVLSMKGASGKLKKVSILAAAVLCIVFFLVKLNAESGMKLSEMRIFDYSQEDVSSGRLDSFALLYNRKNALQHIFGGGLHYDWWAKSIGAANGHNAHFQILLQSGYVGLLLYVIFLISIALYAKRHKMRGGVVLLFFGIWFLTGVGESANVMRGYIGAKLYLGIALAYCSLRKFPGEYPAMMPPPGYWNLYAHNRRF